MSIWTSSRDDLERKVLQPNMPKGKAEMDASFKFIKYYGGALVLWAAYDIIKQPQVMNKLIDVYERLNENAAPLLIGVALGSLTTATYNALKSPDSEYRK